MALTTMSRRQHRATDDYDTRLAECIGCPTGYCCTRAAPTVCTKARSDSPQRGKRRRNCAARASCDERDERPGPSCRCEPSRGFAPAPSRRPAHHVGGDTANPQAGRNNEINRAWGASRHARAPEVRRATVAHSYQPIAARRHSSGKCEVRLCYARNPPAHTDARENGVTHGVMPSTAVAPTTAHRRTVQMDIERGQTCT